MKSKFRKFRFAYRYARNHLKLKRWESVRRAIRLLKIR